MLSALGLTGYFLIGAIIVVLTARYRWVRLYSDDAEDVIIAFLIILFWPAFVVIALIVKVLEALIKLGSGI